MTRVRRLVTGTAIAGTLLIPFAVSSAQPASAYCEGPAPAYANTGCSNSCKDAGNTLSQILEEPGEGWFCPQ